MSSSRRRGRAPGASATTPSPTVTATPTEVADALLAETPADAGSEPETHAPETAEAPVVEAQAAETQAAEAQTVETQAVEIAESPADEAVEASGEPAPAEVQSAADDQPAEAPEETVTAASDEAPAVIAEPEVVAAEAVEAVETATETLAQTALLPALAEAKPEAKASDDARPKTHSVRIGANFAFAPTLAPLTEINAKLFAFARGESEAVLAHFQALARAKSPAEAIRLQVTEMQRAADASLSCFSEIVRSANRLHDTAHRH
ncbi:Phasin [Methylobacterium sp. Leaf123]|uniref:phasin family protein n=1 Tax=Methylobacterium sp. Leaf123 TaxID=1736264 RepID=UPI0007004BA2|nr:phasin family protein [Methylobacterium sp. Leaf123]KQQ31166.1 Phasin [Methylobacterium sp. Leaf123]